MLKTLNKARCCCPIVFYQEIKAVLWEKIDPMNDQKSKISRFLTIYAIFVQFLLDFVDLNVENGQNGPY